MLKRIFVPLLILPLLIAACGGEQPVALDEAPAPKADTAVAEMPTDIPATEAPASPTNEAESPAPVELVSECTIVSSMPEAPAQFAELFTPTENDWVYGPETAAVTIVEYGDFQ